MANKVIKRKYSLLVAFRLSSPVNYLYFSVLIVCGGFLSVGCNNRPASKKKIFHYNEHSGITSLDPAFAKSQATMWPAHQLFNTLVEVDDSLRIAPSLAKSWEVSEDRLTYTFHLRNDVFFHDDAVFENKKGRKLACKRY